MIRRRYENATKPPTKRPRQGHDWSSLQSTCARLRAQQTQDDFPNHVPNVAASHCGRLGLPYARINSICCQIGHIVQEHSSSLSTSHAPQILHHEGTRCFRACVNLFATSGVPHFSRSDPHSGLGSDHGSPSACCMPTTGQANRRMLLSHRHHHTYS